VNDATVTPLLEPSLSDIDKHLDRLFRRARTEYREGLCEIRCLDPAEARPPICQMFQLDPVDLESAARWAAEKNRDGWNVYVGVNPRKPKTVRNKAAKTDDIEIAFFQFADADDEDTSIKLRDGALAYTFAVTTGTEPSRRIQAYWELEEPTRNLRTWTQVQQSIKTLFDSDDVVDPPRIMRLAGTVSIPSAKKLHRGYRTELTSIRTVYAGEEREPIAAASLLAAFPPSAALPADTTVAAAVAFPAAPAPPPPGGLNLPVGGPALNVDEAILQARSDNHWHDNVRNLIASWVARFWSNDEIKLAAHSLRLPGYTEEQTDREIEVMLKGARQKFNIANPAPAPLDPQPAVTVLSASPLGRIDIGKIARRQWVLGDRYIQGFVTLTIAPGGAGKSTLTLEEGVEIHTGRNITGQGVRKTGPMWIINNEDPMDELHRRIAAICLHFDIPWPETMFVNSGVDRRLVVAKQLNGATVATPDVEALIKFIWEHGIIGLIVDPFVRCHMVNENDNAAIDFVAQQFAKICVATGCFVSLVHHSRKAPSSSFGEPKEGDADSARGASALASSSRAAHTLATMSENEAKRLGVDPEKERRWLVRLDDAKGSMSPPAEGARWFKKKSVRLPNGDGLEPGDNVGVLEPWEPPPPVPLQMATAIEILNEVKRRWDKKKPFTKDRTTDDRVTLKSYIESGYPQHARDATGIIADWERNDIVVYETYNRSEKKKGWQFLKYPTGGGPAETD
jgi:hypothetical protein